MSIDFESCAKLHWAASNSRQTEGLRAWWAALTRETPARSRAAAFTKKRRREVGRHPTVLWRLGVVDACGKTYGAGGRKVYLLPEVQAYLQSSACAKRRAQMQTARRASGE